jgi:hypothetical protein
MEHVLAGLAHGDRLSRWLRTICVDGELHRLRYASADQRHERMFHRDPLGEVGHVLVPDVGRERVEADQVQVVEINGFWPSIPRSDVQNATSSVRGSISHRRS